jgi:DNA repair protein RecN (Recombination protein N)
MLRHLAVKNYALIDRVDVSFEPGFTAITGETGSGKSILLGAFGLALGDRADARAIRTGEQKCVVEAVFDVKGYGLESFFNANDLDYSDQTTLRREISANGKSRAFINDTPVALTVLRELSESLIDIHSQHENMLVGTRAFQLAGVDAFANNEQERSVYAMAFSAWTRAVQQLADLRAQELKLRQDLDYFRFQHEELQRSSLEQLDETALNAELDSLMHAETIHAALHKALQTINADEAGTIQAVNTAKSALAKAAEHHPQLPQLVERLESLRIELRDIAGECENIVSSLVFDEDRVEEINGRLSGLQHLLKKHGKRDVAELIALRDELATSIHRADNLDQLLLQAQKETDLAMESLTTAAEKLSASRRRAAKQLEAEVKSNFKSLSLDHAALEVAVNEAREFSSAGRDEVNFLFRANKGSALLPLREVASGGEMSRVTLALKAAVSKYKKLPTLILDEIDQGISGETAVRVARVMRNMSEAMQLISITHLPQIAGKAQHHLKIYKVTGNSTTSTRLEWLDESARIKEVAGMMSGKAVSAATLESARELMEAD